MLYFILQCFTPYFIGDGIKCTIDEDGDGFPNVPLDLCADMNITNTSYCTAVRVTMSVLLCSVRVGFEFLVQN